MKIVGTIYWLCSATFLLAQERSYFYQIPDAPAEYTAATVAARMVDGLGFRYYWATEGLREQDLNYQPQGVLSGEARTTLETIRHILDLSVMIKKAVHNEPLVSGAGGAAAMPYAEVRAQTLANLQHVSELLHQDNLNLAEQKLIFQNNSGTRELPFWNVLNGPIADALWHVGQVVTFRRSSGNPLPSGVSVLAGVKREG